jgi:hypothetical protein
MNKAHALLIAGLLPVTALGALKPEPAVAPLEMFGASIDLKPGLEIGYASDSNYFTEPAGREDSTDLYTISPSLSARVGDDNEFTELLLSATGGWSSFDDADDYTDYRAAYAGKYAPAGNLQLTAMVGTSQSHDERGSGDSDRCTNNAPIPPSMTACPAEPNISQDVNANLSVMLGSSESRGRVTLGMDAMGRRYTNNDLVTDTLEYDTLGGSFKFAWEIGGKTDAVFETRLTDYEYLAGGTAGDSTDMEYLVGVEWDVTGKTTGYAKAGVQEKDFADPVRDDLSDPAGRLGVTWMPSEQGVINLELAKSIKESTVGGTTAKDVTVWNINAQHLINERVEPFVALSFETTEYQGALVPRTDESTSIELGVDYKFRRWVVLGLSWNRMEDSSDFGGGLLDFERDVTALSIDLTL